MNLLEGYIHHVVYIFINYYSVKINIINEYQYFFILEIPTLIKDIGTINKNLRSDLIFGSTMFIFRICYHVYLTIFYVNSVIGLFFSLCTLCTHIYWFNGWVNKYSPISR